MCDGAHRNVLAAYCPDMKEAVFFISVVNAMLIHNFGGNTIRKVKTDKADALKIANYALTYWADLREYTSEDETRQLLKFQSRVYNRCRNQPVHYGTASLHSSIRFSQAQTCCLTAIHEYPTVISNGLISQQGFGTGTAFQNCLSMRLESNTKAGAKKRVIVSARMTHSIYIRLPVPAWLRFPKPNQLSF